MEIQPLNIFWPLITLGFSTGVCIGGILGIVWENHDMHTRMNALQKTILSQRDSLRALRADFNEFRNTHERELMTILRETLRINSENSDAEDP